MAGTHATVLNSISSDQDQTCTLKLFTYNMHGFKQGYSTVRDLINEMSPDIIFIQDTG